MKPNKDLLTKILQLYTDGEFHAHWPPDQYNRSVWNPEKFANENGCDKVIAQYHFEILDSLGCFLGFHLSDSFVASYYEGLTWTGHALLETLQEGHQLPCALTEKDRAIRECRPCDDTRRELLAALGERKTSPPRNRQ